MSRSFTLGAAAAALRVFIPNPSSVSFIGANSAAGGIVTIPAHQAGDLILLVAGRGGNSTPPPVLAGWTSLYQGSNSANTLSATFAYRIAADSSTVSGSWSSQEPGTLVAVYRGVRLDLPIGGLAGNNYGNSVGGSVTYSGITVAQPTNNIVVGMTVRRATNTLAQLAPETLNGRRIALSGASTIALSDSVGSQPSWGAVEKSVDAQNRGSVTCVVELRGAI